MLGRAIRFVGRFLERFWVGAALGVAIMTFPLPVEEVPVAEGIRQGVGAVVVVASLGKALYDTLFYDRYA